MTGEQSMKTAVTSGILLKEYLDDADCAAIRALAEECVRREGVALKLELDYKLQAARNAADQTRVRAVNEFMYFSKAGLVGYAGICGFGGPEGALEITGMAHPDWRRRGVFSLLHGLVADECRRRRAPGALVLCDRDSASGQAFVRKIGAAYSHSEYEMRLNGKFPAIREERLYGVTLRRATNADAGEIARQNALYFGGEGQPDEAGAGENEPRGFVQLPEEEEKRGMTICLAERGGAVVGKVHVETSCAEAGGIYGLGVLPEHRGKGLGRAILLRAIEKLREAGVRDVLLQVESENANALGLYESCGFARTSTMDYFKMDF